VHFLHHYGETKMKKLMLMVAVLSALAAPANAKAVKLPKEFLGTWCLNMSITNGPEPRTNQYGRCVYATRETYDETFDITLRPNGFTSDGAFCKTVKIVGQRDPDGETYTVTYRCISGKKFTATMWVGDGDTLGPMEARGHRALFVEYNRGHVQKEW
jgi:hypothetical protein